MVAFERPDRLTRTEELNFIEFRGRDAILKGDWDVSANPQRILAVELGTSSLGDGAFILYEGQSGAKHLLYQTFSSTGNFFVQPVCPDGKLFPCTNA